MFFFITLCYALKSKKSDNYCCHNSRKSDYFKEVLQKRSNEPTKQNEAITKSNNYGRAKNNTLFGAIEKSPILLSQYWKNKQFYSCRNQYNFRRLYE